MKLICSTQLHFIRADSFLKRHAEGDYNEWVQMTSFAASGVTPDRVRLSPFFFYAFCLTGFSCMWKMWCENPTELFTVGVLGDDARVWGFSLATLFLLI